MSSRSAKRDWRDRVRDILDAIAEVETFVVDYDVDTFVLDRKTVRAVELGIIIIGEAVRAIPPEVQAEHSDIPWNLMRGMRNRLIHAYHSVDEVLMWETIQKDLPPLKTQLQRLIAEAE